MIIRKVKATRHGSREGRSGWRDYVVGQDLCDGDKESAGSRLRQKLLDRGLGFTSIFVMEKNDKKARIKLTLKKTSKGEATFCSAKKKSIWGSGGSRTKDGRSENAHEKPFQPGLWAGPCWGKLAEGTVLV